MSDVRIIDQTTDSSLVDGDYVIVDSTNEGTRKYNLGKEIRDIKEDLDSKTGMSADFKQALHDILEKVAFIDGDGQDYLDALDNAMYPTASSISCVYTQSGTVYTTDTLNSLKSDLVVTALYSDSTTKTLNPSEYTLTGTLTAGTSTIAVHYGNLVSTFTVTVTARTLSSISAVYTQSGTVYSDDALDSLKSGLVVTATYSDSTTEVLNSADYTLSGSLDSGTSTVTVTYSGKTTTFNVSVTLVGTTVYSDSLSNWRLSTTPTASYANNMITMKTTQSNADLFAMWCFDRAKTLWSAVNGKKIRVRITLASPDWVGDMSQVAPRNLVNVGLAIYKNATITAGGDRQKYQELEELVLTSEPITREYIFDCDISNFSSGTGTPTSSSTFGLQVYDCSANTINITSAEIVEVLN